MNTKISKFELNPNNDVVEIKPSKIHGLGLFAKKNIAKGYVLGPAMIDRSIATQYSNNLADNYDNVSPDDNWVQVIGTRFLNHSFQPNVKFEIQDNILETIAIKNISVGEEITVNYHDYFSHTSFPLPDFLKR